LSQKWATWLSVDGDLRFASHRDMMRSIERLAVRAGVSLRYTQGFNPHPILSLVPPRPVGVASRDDLLVMMLDEPTDASRIVSGLNAAKPPEGLTFIGAAELPAKATPQPRKARYELPLEGTRIKTVAARLSQLEATASWPVERMVKVGRRRRQRDESIVTKTVDLRLYVTDLRITQRSLCFALLSDKAGGARPGEVLGLCGLDERTDLAVLVRVAVDYCLNDSKMDFRTSSGAA